MPRQGISRDLAVAQIKYVAFDQRQHLGVLVAAVDHVLGYFPDLPVAQMDVVVPVELIEIEVRVGRPGQHRQVFFVHVDLIEQVHHACMIRMPVRDDHVVGLVRQRSDGAEQIIHSLIWRRNTDILNAG